MNTAATSRWRRIAGGLLAMSLAATACAGSEGAESSDTEAATETSASTEEASAAAADPTAIPTEANGIVADATANSREAIVESINSEDWAFPAQFIDCELPGCTGESTPGVYQPIPKGQITEEWSICALLPHVADPYWVGTNYALITEAQRAGVNLQVLEAGGYTEVSNQIDQLENCAAGGADALLVGAVSNEALNVRIEELAADGTVIIDLINGVTTEAVDGRVLFNYCLMGGNLGGYLKSSGSSANAVWFPGPAGVGALEDLMNCFEGQAEGAEIDVLGVQYGDTNRDEQLSLIENALGAYPDMDYIVGSAVTVEAAATALEERRLSDSIRTASYYFTPEVYELIKEGKAACASTGSDIMLARMALDMAVRVLEGVGVPGGYRHIGPDPQVICGPAAGDEAENLDTFVEETTLAPADFEPTFNYAP